MWLGRVNVLLSSRLIIWLAISSLIPRQLPRSNIEWDELMNWMTSGYISPYPLRFDSEREGGDEVLAVLVLGVTSSESSTKSIPRLPQHCG